MRHRKRKGRLGRKSSHRKATLRSLACALLRNESIKTTKRKAKVAQSFVERLITIAKENTPNSKRAVFALIRNKELIKVLFEKIAPRFRTRNGGYTRVIPLYPRRGDGSLLAILELVEKSPITSEKRTKSKKEKPKPYKEKMKKAEQVQEEYKQEEHKIVPPKPETKGEKRIEKAKEEKAKTKKGGFIKNLRRFFRGKAP